MVKSMTGYGRAERHTEQKKITVEIKSVNSKQLDLSVRMPSLYREKEYEIRGLVGRALGRGKVDLFVSVENIGAKALAGTINEELFGVYFRQLETIALTVGCDMTNESLIPAILRLPDVLQCDVAVVGDEEWATLMDAVQEAVDNINSFREQEGAVLIADLLDRVDKIQELAAQIVPYEAERIETVRTRLADNLKNLQVDVDTNRFEQEVIYYLEKYDITEEKVRLAQHCDYFRQVARGENVGEKDGNGVGRKLGFISQEIGREINTTGSKANHAEIQKLVVRMKDELEKIKEQLLNIL